MTRVFCTINPFCIKDWSSRQFFIWISIAVITTDVQIEFGLRLFDFHFKGIIILFDSFLRNGLQLFSYTTSQLTLQVYLAHI